MYVQFQQNNTISFKVNSTGAQINLGLCSLIWIIWFVALHNPLPYKCPPLFTCLFVKAEAQFVTANRISWHHNRKASKESFRNTLAKHSAGFCPQKCRSIPTPQQVHRDKSYAPANYLRLTVDSVNHRFTQQRLFWAYPSTVFGFKLSSQSTAMRKLMPAPEKYNSLLNSGYTW
jgi:hypothetical protein